MSNEIDRADPPDPYRQEIEADADPEQVQPEAKANEFAPAQQAKANTEALKRLRTEITGKPLDAAQVKADVKAQNASRDWRTPEQDATEVLRRRRAVAASAEWNALDRLAMTRAAIWITHADAFGHGVNRAEIGTLIQPRAAAEIPATARAIVLRLSKIIAAPEADGVALARSDALAGIVARDEQPAGA